MKFVNRVVDGHPSRHQTFQGTARVWMQDACRLTQLTSQPWLASLLAACDKLHWYNNHRASPPVARQPALMRELVK